MNYNKSLIVNHFDSKSRSQILFNDPLLSSKDLGKKGIKFDYFQCDANELATHIHEHHVVCIVLNQIELERKLNGVYQHEAANFGSVAIMPAEVEHWSAWKTLCKFVLFSIQPQELARIAPEIIDPDRVKLIPTFTQPEPDGLIAGIGMAIKQTLENDPVGCGLYTESLLNSLCLHLLYKYTTVKPLIKEYKEGLAPYKLKQVIELICDRLSEDVTIEQMSNYIDLSPAYFARQFKKSTGLTPHQYVTKERLEKAKRLLKNRDIPLAHIAADCGFTHQSHMGKLFKQATGLTPRKYRNEIN